MSLDSNPYPHSHLRWEPPDHHLGAFSFWPNHFGAGSRTWCPLGKLSPPSPRLSLAWETLDQSPMWLSFTVLRNSFSAPHNRHIPGLVGPWADSINQWCTWSKGSAYPQKLTGLLQDALHPAVPAVLGAVPPYILRNPGERADNYPVLVLVDWVSATAT